VWGLVQWRELGVHSFWPILREVSVLWGVALAVGNLRRGRVHKANLLPQSCLHHLVRWLLARPRWWLQ